MTMSTDWRNEEECVRWLLWLAGVVDACDRVIVLVPHEYKPSMAALLKRANAHRELGEWKEAQRDGNQVRCDAVRCDVNSVGKQGKLDTSSDDTSLDDGLTTRSSKQNFHQYACRLAFRRVR